MIKKNTQNSGFTLIELMVVIAIIGLLSAIVLASLSSAREKAQNAATKQTVHQIQLALALYDIDNSGYPNPLGANQYLCIGASSCTNPINGTTVSNQLALNDISPVPGTNNYFSLHTLLKPETAEAATYTTAGNYLQKFNPLTTPVLYVCSGSEVPCSSANALIVYPTKQNGATVANAVYASNNNTGSI